RSDPREARAYDREVCMRPAQSPFLVGCLSTLLVFSIGCARRPSDDAIARDIQKKIAENPATKDAPVTVSAQAGKVTLTGQVKGTDVGEKLELIARERPGATAVENRTTAAPQPASTTKAAGVPPAATPPESVTPPPPSSPPPPEPPKPKPIIVPAGTILTVK